MIKSKPKLYSFLLFASLFSALLLPVNGMAKTDSAIVYFTPWSGYWWPTTGGGLANGYGNRSGPAPLEKLELLSDGRFPGAATRWELEHHYDPGALDWEGQCHAWAAASAYENIVFYPSSYNNIIFRVGDKKGLISACHGSDITISAFGGNPVTFHEWLLNYIKVQRRSFIVDLFSEEEVWYYPVYKYSMQLTEKSGVTSVVCQIWYAGNNVEPDYQGLKEKTRIFTYDLYTNGKAEITGGRWTGNSVYSRPRTLKFPLLPQATNPYLDYETIRSIAVHKDDFLESPAPVRLLPGNYNLILLNDDQYILDAQVGDTISLEFEKLDDFPDGIDIVIQNGDGETIWQNTLLDPLSHVLTTVYPPYLITMSRPNYGGGGIYRLLFDQIKTNQVVIPDLQKGSAWNGLAVTNPTPDPIDNVQVVTYDADHRPIATVKGPFDLDAFQKDAWTVSSLPMRLHEAPSVRSVKILSDETVAVVYMGGLDQKTMSGLGQAKATAPRLIFPDMASMFNINKQVAWGVSNATVADANLDLRLYNQQGFLDRQVSLILPGNTIGRYTASNNPFNKSIDHGWIAVQVNGDNDNTASGVSGFFNWQKDGTGKAESVFPLSRIDRRFTVPHLAVSHQWQTELTLINLSDQPNTVTCQLIEGMPKEIATIDLVAHEKISVSIGDLFPQVDHHALNQSVLKIESSSDITGYFAYQTDASRAIFELMGASQGLNLNLPHLASDAYWWTGVALFNSSQATITVTLVPVAANGETFDADSQIVTIPPLTKKVFLIRSLFGDSIRKKTGWLQIKGDGNGIMGLFLIGDQAMQVLSGAELYSETIMP